MKLARVVGDVLLVEAEDDRAAAALAVPGQLEVRRLVAARDAPRGPEVQDDRRAAQFAQAEAAVGQSRRAQLGIASASPRWRTSSVKFGAGVALERASASSIVLLSLLAVSAVGEQRRGTRPRRGSPRRGRSTAARRARRGWPAPQPARMASFGGTIVTRPLKPKKRWRISLARATSSSRSTRPVRSSTLRRNHTGRRRVGCGQLRHARARAPSSSTARAYGVQRNHVRVRNGRPPGIGADRPRLAGHAQPLAPADLDRSHAAVGREGEPVGGAQRVAR